MPDDLSEDFTPVIINAATVKATDKDDAGTATTGTTVTGVKIVSTHDGVLQYTDDGDATNDDVMIVTNTDGTFSLALTASGAGKFGTVTTAVTLVDAAGNPTTSNVDFIVKAINDAPVNSVPTDGVVNTTVSEANADIGIPLLGLSVHDPDEATGPAENKIQSVTITVDDGCVSVTGKGATSDPNLLVITGNNTATLTLTGDQQHINDELASMRYKGSGTATAKDVTLTMTSTDGGDKTKDANGVETITNTLQDKDPVVIHITAPTTATALSAGAPITLAELSASNGSGAQLLDPGTTSVVSSGSSLTSLIGEVHQTT